MNSGFVGFQRYAFNRGTDHVHTGFKACGRRRRDRAATRIAARARLFGDAGLPVQPAEAGGRSQADAVCAPARARGDKPEPRSQAKTRRADGVKFRAMKAGTCRSRFASSPAREAVSI